MTLNLQDSTHDWLVCSCGNTPLGSGFYCCTSYGKIVSPSITDGKWDTAHVLCMGCNAIYNQDTMEQNGTASHPSVVDYNKNIDWDTY